MNNLRSTLLVAVAAFVAAACGDKVTVQGPTSATATIKSVTVAPASATLNIGDQITLTAAVNADAGLATTVTWKSSDATKASVDASGNVKGLAGTPGVAVCATSTVDTGKIGCASVIVTQATAPIGASVSIASITIGGVNNGLNTQVNPLNVANQIDVKINIAPGNQTPSRVDLLVGPVGGTAKVVAFQSFTPSQAAALRSAADEAIAAQSTFPSVVLSYNTAAYDTLTGIPTSLNGAVTLSVKLYTVQGQSTAAGNASTPLTLNNADGWHATTVATTGTTANALNAAGYRYDRGGLNIVALPVLYSGRAIQRMTAFFGNNGCDSFLGTRNRAMVAPAAGSNAYTLTWAQTTPNDGFSVDNNYLTNYEFVGSAGACANTNLIGESVNLSGIDANGDALFGAKTPINQAAVTNIRLDNRAPVSGNVTLIQNPNFRQNGWFNGAVGVLASNDGTPTGDGLTVRPASTNTLGFVSRDAGQGSYIRFARVAAVSPTGTVDLALAATAASTFTLPAPSLTNNTYCVIITARDALGNETALPAAGTACPTAVTASSTALASYFIAFGVDIVAPTLVENGSAVNATYLDANDRRGANGTIVNTFADSVYDTGTIGNSGMQSNAAVIGTVLLRNDATTITAANKCVIGLLQLDNSCLATSVNSAPTFPVVTTAPTAPNSLGAAFPGATAITGSNVAGYYTYTRSARDAAGNSSVAVTKVIAFNVNTSTPALTTAIYNTPLNGPSATFNANGSSNFDLRDVRYTLSYPTLAGPVIYPRSVINGYNGVQMFSNVASGITIPNFMRQVEQLTGTQPIAAAGLPQKPTQLSGVLRDQANVSSAAVPTAINGASVTNGVSYIAVANPAQQVNGWVITNVATNVSDGGGPAAATAALSATLNAVVNGPTATLNPPFARVDFYAFFGGNLVQIGSATVPTTIDDGSAQGRRHTYSITWTPGTSFGLGAVPVYAIGVNALGDALATQANNNIAVINP
jgi:hypothetical protein